LCARRLSIRRDRTMNFPNCRTPGAATASALSSETRKLGAGPQPEGISTQRHEGSQRAGAAQALRGFGLKLCDPSRLCVEWFVPFFRDRDSRTGGRFAMLRAGLLG
jgi:hypothetical protein